MKLIRGKYYASRIKAVSIPRLELMAAVLGVRLAETVSEKLEIPLSQHTVWTDSMKVIYWIQGHSRRLKSFVANQVAEIQRKSRPTQWRHVASEENPADDATRGLDLRDLSAESRWFRGPAFLHEGEESWPSKSRPGQTDCTEEGKQELSKINLSFQSKKSLLLFDAEKFSSWLRLLRITAYVLRFIFKCKIAGLQKEQKNVSSDNQEKNTGPDVNLEEALEPEEIKNVERYWVREAQRERFTEELTNLKGGGTVSKKSQLWRLSPFMDSDRILRVDGRLQLSSLPYDAKHPVILPKKHHISKLVVAHVHNQGHHNLGVNLTLAELRQKFWIVNGREEIKRWERKCNFCISFKQSTEGNKSCHPYQMSGWEHRCDALPIAESILLVHSLSS